MIISSNVMFFTYILLSCSTIDYHFYMGITMGDDLIKVAKDNLEEFLLRKYEVLEVKLDKDILFSSWKEEYFLKNASSRLDEKEVKDFMSEYGALILIDGHELRTIWDYPNRNGPRRSVNALSYIVRNCRINDLFIPAIRKE